MKSFDEWMKEQGQSEGMTIDEARQKHKQNLADCLNGGLKWEEYDIDKDKPDPDDPYPQAGECCRCGATTEFHDGNFFYCGGSPRCYP